MPYATDARSEHPGRPHRRSITAEHYSHSGRRPADLASVRRIEKGAAGVATDDDTTPDESAMRPVGLDVDDPGNPFPRFGLVLVVILAAFIISGIDQRWAQVVGLGLTALLTIVTYREAYFPKRVGHVVIVGSIALVAAIAIGMIREESSWRAVPMFIQSGVLAFGNQLPTESFSSRIVVTQAVLGQVFLATLVARLVTLYGNARRATPDGA
jgi:hypothetical protein